jgi:hypothetical protein
VKDGNGNLLADSLNILNMWEKYFSKLLNVPGGSDMIGTDLCVNKPHCAAAVRP